MFIKELYEMLLEHESFLTQHEYFAIDALTTAYVCSCHPTFHTKPNQRYVNTISEADALGASHRVSTHI